MNNLVKQQGCAGSGVTDFTPTVRLLSESRVKKPKSVCHSWQEDLRLPTCVSHSIPLVLLPLSYGIPILLLHFHPQPTIQYFLCERSLPSQWMQRFLSRQSDTAAHETLCLFPESSTWGKNETALERGVTGQADHREKGESALYHSILCKATVIPSVQTLRGCKYVVPERERFIDAQGLWFHMPAVGAWISTLKKIKIVMEELSRTTFWYPQNRPRSQQGF